MCDILLDIKMCDIDILKCVILNIKMCDILRDIKMCDILRDILLDIKMCDIVL